MLGKRKKSRGHTTIISSGTEIRGDLKFTGHLEVEGTVVGNISATEGSEAFVRVLQQGRVEGEINVPSVVINGAVVGDVHSSQHLELAENANVTGDVHYAVIEMAKGSHVNGSLVFSDDTNAKADKKVASIAEVKLESNT